MPDLRTRTLSSAASSPKKSAYQARSEEHTSELQSPCNLVCRLLLEKKKKTHQLSYRSSYLYRSAHLASEILMQPVSHLIRPLASHACWRSAQHSIRPHPLQTRSSTY